MITILAILLSLFLSSHAQAGVLSPVFKLAEKAAGRSAAKAAAKTALHEADDVAKFVLHESDDVTKIALHESDDLAKAGAHAGGKAAAEATVRSGGMVERSIAAERAAARAAAPAVPEIHRTVIVPPKTVLAGGAAVAGTVAAHNLTIGERKKDEAVADGIRNDPEAAERIASGGLLHMLGAGGGRALVILAWLLGGGIGMAAIFRALPVRHRRPAVIDVTPEFHAR